ncbi:MAG: chitobiase/beta-hexosaminidase C-terminal domain-containing protein, partial [Phycisphaerales bacterium]
MLRAMETVLLSLVLVAFLAGSAEAQSYPVGDLNGDGNVDFEDLRLFAERWLDPSCLIPGCDADLDGANGVNMVDLALLAENWGLEGVTPVISEFMASNGSKMPLEEGELLDEDGDSSDWIEVYNPTDETVNLGGWHLTNDADNLDGWEFPNGIRLDPGQFLIVFASGKNRTIAGAELHTSFSLDIEGEYLALVHSDGVTVVHEYGPRYPQQLTDISYGLGQYATTLVPSGATASYRVPTVSDAGKNWTAPGFDDSAWRSGSTGLGFGNASPGFEVIYYKANIAVGNLSAAESVISNPSRQSGVAAETAPVINYLNNGANGHFGNDNPFPSTTIGSDVDDFVVLVTSRVLIPQAGEWTFGVSSDDGFGLELTNGTHTLTFSHPDPRGAGDTLAAFNVPEYGLYELRLVFYERGGSSELEFFAARGSYSSFNSAHFRLVGDIASGGLYAISYGSAASTDVQQQMQNVNGSMWARIEFEGEEVDFFDSLALRMKYEDGFVAYLNGAEIARSNFAGAAQWDSVADDNRANELAAEFVNFDASNLTSVLREGNNVLAIHGLNDDKADGEFLILPELVAASNRTMPQYFSAATPGQFNVAGALNIVADTKFSHDRGFYDAPFEVTITCETPWATIYYTTDGSAPSETHGYPYTSPIPIHKSTCLRAMAFKPGWMPTDVDTQTYIFLDNVISQSNNPSGFPTSWGGTSADYEMDPDIVNSHRSTLKDDLLSIPTMSLVMELEDLFGSSGIYPNWGSSGVAWERPGSIELINPDGSEGFQVDCGVRIYGGVGRREKKKTFRLLFKRDYGPTKLRFPLFGANAADEFDTIILRANFNDAYVWGGSDSQYVRDEFMRRLQLDLGGAAPYGDFVHLYVNGLYWGLFNPVERPDTAFSATYFGGDKEDWDGINSTRPTGESQTTAWNTLMNMVGQGLETNEAYQRLQGNNPDGTNNPEHEDYLDIENYIRFLLANYYGGNNDWMSHNWYAGRLRGPESTGWKSYTWDAEWVMGMRSGLNDNAVNDTTTSNYLLKPHTYLRYNTEYLMLFADLAHKAFFDGGPLYVDASNPGWDPDHPERNRPAALYAELADLVEGAMIAESARWGDVQSSTPYNINQWRNERDWVLNAYAPQRSGIVLQQLRNANLYPSIDAPVFYINGLPQHGGQTSSGDSLLMGNPNGVGTVYYTIDGNEARLPVVVETTGTTLLEEDAAKRVLIPTGNIGNNWKGGNEPFNDSGWNDATFISGRSGGVGYDENPDYRSYISYDVEAKMNEQYTSAYIRIPFTVNAEDAAGFNFMTLKMKYDDGFVAYLNGAEVARRNFSGAPSWNSRASSGHDDSAAVTFENIDISGSLGSLQDGGNVLAIHGLNVGTTSSDFLISVQLVAGESTFTGEILSPSAIEYTGPVTLDESVHIKARVLSGSTWSALNEATFAVGPVADNLRITEIMYHPQDTNDPNDPNEEFIELKNIG